MLRAYWAGLAGGLLACSLLGCGSSEVASPSVEMVDDQSSYTAESPDLMEASGEEGSPDGLSYAAPPTVSQPVKPQPAASSSAGNAIRPPSSAQPASKRMTSDYAIDTSGALVPRYRELPREAEPTVGDRFDQIVESGFLSVHESPLSTFSIDVDTASYAKTRMFLQQRNQLPPADAVRIEELVNYFDYDYSPPTGDDPFAVHMEVARAPWQPQHLLARVGIKGREMTERRPAGNLVFLIDVSGSMNRPNKLGLVKAGLKMLTSQLNDDDRVSIVVYAGAAGLVLPPTHGDNRHVILDALDRLAAGGSTNGAQGIQLAYKVAQENFIKGGVNRVLLCTDGDFNVGTTNTGDLVRLAAGNARDGVFLSVLGFGMGNHNDAMLEKLSNQANGNYAFMDSDREAKKVLLDQLDSTLVTIAKDVKIQIEFNPRYVASYRLIGYENRRLADRDFNDDKKDAGEIGAGHTVTALYELVPADGAEEAATPRVDPLKYQTRRQLAAATESDDLLNLKLRFKRPANDRSELVVFPIKNKPLEFGQASGDFQFAAAVAEFGMLLRNSAHRGDASYAEVLEIAASSRGRDGHGYRREFLDVVNTARSLVEPDTTSSLIVDDLKFKHSAVQPMLPSNPEMNGWPTLSLRLLLVTIAVVWLVAAALGLVIVVWALLRRSQQRDTLATTVKHGMVPGNAGQV